MRNIVIILRKLLTYRRRLSNPRLEGCMHPIAMGSKLSKKLKISFRCWVFNALCYCCWFGNALIKKILLQFDWSINLLFKECVHSFLMLHWSEKTLWQIPRIQMRALTDMQLRVQIKITRKRWYWDIKLYFVEIEKLIFTIFIPIRLFSNYEAYFLANSVIEKIKRMAVKLVVDRTKLDNYNSLNVWTCAFYLFQ